MKPLALFALLLPALAEAQAPVDTAAVDAYVRGMMDRAGLPGAAVVIVRGGAIAYAGAYGEGVTAEAPFLIGSLSKSVTALAVAQLAGAGRLDLDAPAQHHLPTFDFPGAGAVTVRHLLNQRSGLTRPDGMDHRAVRDGRYDHLRLAFAPGTDYAYSNLNYVLLGRIVEAVSGRPYADYVRAEIGAPLGLTSLGLGRDDAEARGLVQGHQRFFWWSVPRREPAHAEAATPAGYVALSAHDLGRWLLAHLNPDSAGAITPGAAALLHIPPEGSRYAGGWSRFAHDGQPLLAHDGAVGAFRSIALLRPEHGDGVGVLLNLNMGMVSSFGLGQEPADELAFGLLDLLDGEAPPAPSFPWERVLRLALLGLVVRQLASLARKAQAWTRRGFPLRLQPSPRVLGGLAFGLLFSLGWLVAVPVFFGLPVGTLVALQPDLGLALVVGAAGGGAEAVLKALLRSAEALPAVAAPAAHPAPA